VLAGVAIGGTVLAVSVLADGHAGR
jgi:hypothetical protein